jgi:hypothetical protein
MEILSLNGLRLGGAWGKEAVAKQLEAVFESTLGLQRPRRNDRGGSWSVLVSGDYFSAHRQPLAKEKFRMSGYPSGLGLELPRARSLRAEGLLLDGLLARMR